MSVQKAEARVRTSSLLGFLHIRKIQPTHSFKFIFSTFYLKMCTLSSLSCCNYKHVCTNRGPSSPPWSLYLCGAVTVCPRPGKNRNIEKNIILFFFYRPCVVSNCWERLDCLLFTLLQMQMEFFMRFCFTSLFHVENVQVQQNVSLPGWNGWVVLCCVKSGYYCAVLHSGWLTVVVVNFKWLLVEASTQFPQSENVDCIFIF